MPEILPVKKLTKTRQALLQKMAENAGAELALLFLIDNGNDQITLVASYIHPDGSDAAGYFRNIVSPLPEQKGDEIADEAIVDAARELVRASGLPETQQQAFSYEILKTDWSPFEANPEFGGERQIGVLAISAKPLETQDSQALVDHIATSISIGRYQRFVSTVRRIQRSLSSPEGTLDETVIATTKLLAKELGATDFVYQNRNQGRSRHFKVNARTGRWSSNFKLVPPRNRRDSSSQHTSNATNEVARRARDNNEIEITLSQKAYEISNQPFRGLANLSALFTERRTEAVEITVRHKDVDGYLQKRFSETDFHITEAVFRNVQDFFELKLSEDNHNLVFSILLEELLTPESSPQTFLNALRRITASINNVFIVSVESFGEEIEVVCDAADGKLEISDEYVSRLRGKYLTAYYHGKRAPDYGHLAVGIDANKGHHYLEIHAPSEFGNAKLFVVSFSQDVMSQATFRAITNLFNEIFIRMKNDEFQLARSNVLTETRHAVIHQFAAAMHSMEDMRAKWDRGLKNRSFWVSLLDDPVFPENLDQASFSLSNAQQILDNGRYLIKDINPKEISRKPFNMYQVIADCQRVLRIEARRKLIRLHQGVRGEPPTTMNGDEVLMRMAILNLFDNAIKYSLHGNVISWELIYRPDRYEFRISNDGDLLSEERFNLLLQVGVRGKQRDHLNLRPGTGLGLPVTHRILKAHSSTAALRLRSDLKHSGLGGGTNTFWFELPYLTGLERAERGDESAE